MANAVERRLNDLLLRDEALKMVHIDRRPIYVSCVSNFSNFLDLFRKSIRSLEVGVPVVILGRSNTAQHCFRWTQLLVQLMTEQGVDPGMVTFLSCALDDIKDITRSCKDQTGNLYTTCSRELAAAIKSDYPNTVASTGGPNTLVTTQLTDAVKQAVQTSASIESSGQCTALRHCVVPLDTSDEDLEGVFGSIHEINDAPHAVKNLQFDGVFSNHKGSAAPDDGSGYKRHANADAYYKISDELPPAGMNEYWRRVAIDFSKLDLQANGNVNKLATWLNTNQPISLAVNGPRKEALKLGLELFGKTGMVVNTIGSTDDADMAPAMTCQARPQEAEIFGEFPPRTDLNKYTRFPVVVPSSNPSYGATYVEAFLANKTIPSWFGESTKNLLGELESPLVRGYCVILIKYLQDVARQNPKQGFGKSRTAVWGLQRPPLGTKTILRCSPSVDWDGVCPIFVLFHATNARPQVELSIDPANKELVDLCRKHNLSHDVETAVEAEERAMSQPDLMFNTVQVEEHLLSSFPMAGNFVSLYFPLGHIKSTKPNDLEFTLLARLSDKWLNTLF
ncbi:hypothetical protein MPSEU_000417600 [Mayamaea pseudoterrestris]|nr:hypothetical protein MPSEU_000417600 [Mayamaea pseudoterrestris]